jgi:hypothetical protein
MLVRIRITSYFSLILFFLFCLYNFHITIQNNKNMQTYVKITKYFHKQTLILNQVIVHFIFFLNQIINQFNSTLSHLSFNIKNTNKFQFATWLFISNLFQTNIKNTKTNQTSISTPNYEVLILHGYVGKGHASFQINKI